MSNFYALLVGINDYPRPVPALRGCLNDIEMLASYLRERLVSTDVQLHLRFLNDQEATRKSVIEAFREHLGQAQAGDYVLFAFNGHGSQEDAPPELWHLEPDRLNETLVCWDSRSADGRDLADKELATLIAEVAENGPKITVILDCCHAGSGSRPLNTRYVEPDRRPRTINSYLWAETHSRSTTAPWSTVPQGRHILLAACRDMETAKEDLAKKRGAFSYFLMETLSQSESALTYREVFKRTQALVTAKVPHQTPQLEATHEADLETSFLGIGADRARGDRGQYFTVAYRADLGWTIDAGALHGIPQSSSQDTTHLALFHLGQTGPTVLSEAIGEARVVEVLPQLSRINVANVSSLNEGEVYRAIATSMPLAPLGVIFTGDTAGIDQLNQCFTGDSQRPSLHIALVADEAQAQLRVKAIDEHYQILSAVGEQPLVRDLVGYEPAIAERVIQQLEHIARWQTVAALSSSPTSRIPAEAIQLEILQDGQVLAGAPVLLRYQPIGNRWRQPTFQVKLTNQSNLPLYCALLDLTARYAIQPFGFEAGGVWLQPGETAWAQEGNPLYASVPKELWQQGVTEFQDIFKLLVCTAEFDARLMAQDNLDAPAQRSGEVSALPKRASTLNRLMRRVQHRDIGAEPEDSELLDDWSTSQVAVVTVRPQEAHVIAPQGTPLALGAGVTIHAHDSLKAIARLTSVSEVTRSLDQPTLPLIFTQDTTESERLYFTRSRSSDPGLSVLELVAASDSLQTVTPTNPLRLSVPLPLEAGEVILPIAYDGEFFLPLGRSQTTSSGTEVRLERLPPPAANSATISTSAADRSLKSTVRIFFQKILSNQLGLAFEYPQLSAVYLLENGQVVYEKEPATLRPQIAEAKRILLLIHGLMGDTPNLIKDLQKGDLADWLRDRYDLVLAFDYESFNTAAENTAQKLKLHLETVGLHANHSKQLDILGYELGGLIARWFVEREGGHAWVRHLVLVGAPGGGSPWPTIQTWVNNAVAIGLNSLMTVAWPIRVIGGLLLAFENIDVTIDQLQPRSDFLESLAASPCPPISYSVIYGNASIKSAALSPDAAGSSVAQRLFEKLMGGAAHLAFLSQPNDLFASAYSLKLLAQAHQPSPEFQEVACDHFTYFSSQASQALLKQALSK